MTRASLPRKPSFGAPLLATSPIQLPRVPGVPICSCCRTPGRPLELRRSAPSVISLHSDGPISLGWLLVPFGKTTVLSMSGASPGGVAVLVVVPEHDLAFAAFGNDPRAMALHDQILLWLLRDHLNVEVPDLVSYLTPVSDLTHIYTLSRPDALPIMRFSFSEITR